MRLHVGREYWWCFPTDSDVYKETGKHWNKLKISHFRSGVYFYVVCDATNLPERHFDEASFLAMTLEFAQIDPIKDLDFDSDEPKELLEKKHCFCDDRTEVVNWDNSKESEIDENELSLLGMLMNTINNT